MVQETGKGSHSLTLLPGRLMPSSISTILIYLILVLIGASYMTDKSTLDTNILIYAFGKKDDIKP
jgi:hypothetical protein